MSVRILLVDDHAILRAGLRALLSTCADFEVVGEAGNGADAIALVGSLAPDVAVMDIAMPGMNGLVATRQIAEQYPDTRVLVLTQYDNKEYVLPLLKIGAAAYVLKQAVGTDLIEAIRAVARGESYLYPSVARTVLDAYQQVTPDDDPYDRLTDREREVLILVAQGHTTRQIGDVLHISPNTVDVHRARLMQKLDLHSAVELSAFAMRRGLVDL